MAQIEGVVVIIRFRNDANGYTVLTLRTGAKSMEDAVGFVPSVSVGERLRLTGEWVEHPSFGQQLRIDKSEIVPPVSAKEIEKYLSSGKIEGIDEKIAKKLVKKFGKDTLRILAEEPDKIAQVDGIDDMLAEQIAENYAAVCVEDGIISAIGGYGVTSKQACAIYKVFGTDSINILRNDPYMIAKMVHGIGFQTMDKIALSQGVEMDSPKRIDCGVEYTLQEAASSEGHTYLPKTELLEKAEAILRVPQELIDTEIRAMLLHSDLTQENLSGSELIYLTPIYISEMDVAKRLCVLTHTFIQDDLVKKAEEHIAQYEKNNGVSLGEGQRQAVLQAVSGPLTIITGGPGTGKTTGIKCILALLPKGKTELCAPTGRAAKRMSEATGRSAKTIHRLLEYAGDDEMFAKNESKPLDADTIIVDEMSMMDIFLMRALLKAIKPGARLIMVGDADQLPSVGAGNVLHDLCACGQVPVIRLTEIFRQAQESMIVMNAHRINHGEYPVYNGKTSDFFLERTTDGTEAQQSVLSLVSTRLPKYLSLEPKQIQVIAPMKKGEVGIIKLNDLLQQTLNPAQADKNEIKRGDIILREGDKVMQTRNNYSMEWVKGDTSGVGVFNGDMGYITSVWKDGKSRYVEVLFDDEKKALYTGDSLQELELAYALTVHKSQGSEFPCVVMPVVRGPELLMTRNLLYTAVTRAKRLVVLVGWESSIAKMVGNNHIASRYSGLQRRLQEAYQV